MKKTLVSIFLLIFALNLVGCSKKNLFFNNKELENFGLNNFTAPNNATNFYNKSSKNMLFCYMSVSKDDDVRNFVSTVLDMFENNETYKMYGYAKGNDMFERERNIYLSKDIDDYRINFGDYSEDDVTFNAYEIYYSLHDESKNNTMFILGITSYTEQNTNYLSGYNLIISVIKKNKSNYNVIAE